MQSQEITTAQRFVKSWIAEAHFPYSVIPLQNLRIVYVVLTENRISTPEFQKKASRCGLNRERLRLYNSSRADNPVRGVKTSWKASPSTVAELTDKYFNAQDLQMLKAVQSQTRDAK